MIFINNTIFKISHYHISLKSDRLSQNSRPRIDKDVHSEAARMPLVLISNEFAQANSCPPSGHGRNYHGWQWFQAGAMFWQSQNSRQGIDKDVHCSPALGIVGARSVLAQQE